MTRTRRLSLVIAAFLAVAILAGYAVGSAWADAGGARTDISDWDDKISNANDDIDDANDQIADAQDSISSTEREQEAAEARAEELEHALEDTDAEIVEADAKLRELQAQMPAAQAAVDEANEKVAAAVVEQGIVADKLKAARAQDKALSKQIAEDEERADELRSLVAAIARESYKGGQAQSNLGIVFGSQDANQFVDDFTAAHSAARVQSTTLAELDEITAVNRNRAVRQEAVREYIEDLKVEADALVVKLEEAREVAEEKKAELDALVDEAEEVKAYLESKKDEFIAQQQENEALQQQLRDQVADLVAAEIAAREAKEAAELAKIEAEEGKAAAEAAAKENEEESKPRPIGSGYFKYPTYVPYVTSSYGMRYHPIFHYPRLHAGTDFRAYCGTPIIASASGTVVWATYRGGFGNQVMLDHGTVYGNSVYTSYNHLSSYAVSSGQSVSQGQIVGYSGNTGNSTACHLHFEMYVNGQTKDPMSILN